MIVLNGSGRSGAAAASAERIRGVGYTIGSVGNAPRSDFARTIVMFRPGYRAEAVRLAADLKLKIVGPLDGLRRSDLLGAHLARSSAAVSSSPCVHPLECLHERSAREPLRAGRIERVGLVEVEVRQQRSPS